MAERRPVETQHHLARPLRRVNPAPRTLGEAVGNVAGFDEPRARAPWGVRAGC
jgi:hypothetical protein